MTTFFGFAMSDSMFQGNVRVARTVLSSNQAKEIIAGGVSPCLNKSHAATIAAMKDRFGIQCEIPPKPPSVLLTRGDKLLVLQVGGLPRLTDRHEYTAEEIEKASFAFSLWEVLE